MPELIRGMLNIAMAAEGQRSSIAILPLLVALLVAAFVSARESIEAAGPGAAYMLLTFIVFCGRLAWAYAICITPHSEGVGHE